MAREVSKALGRTGRLVSGDDVAVGDLVGSEGDAEALGCTLDCGAPGRLVSDRGSLAAQPAASTRLAAQASATRRMSRGYGDATRAGHQARPSPITQSPQGVT